ncbi:hypothetical protein [Paludisphaera borealis]|uniref:Uncharacterized protein n=1 Tax=Paludisphaera borealis TaxID=1387353 RepID=A0A1U7CVZ2_9BACT|nr:hypothetical protein [Paludisphaera borealis]APW63059.1 hypothetical protein BSF38_04617 [Paludisphaera borealis]
MSSHKKAQKPKRLFSEKNQARRAPPILHSETKDWGPSYIGEFDELYEPTELDYLRVFYERGVLAPDEPFDFDSEDLNEFGRLKMSVVLKEFVRPVWDEEQSERALSSMLLVASLAWNLALSSDAVDEAEVRSLLLEGRYEGVPADEDEVEAAIDFVRFMIGRKHAYFENEKRPILNATIEVLPDGQKRLLVVSGLTQADLPGPDAIQLPPPAAGA